MTGGVRKIKTERGGTLIAFPLPLPPRCRPEKYLPYLLRSILPRPIVFSCYFFVMISTTVVKMVCGRFGIQKSASMRAHAACFVTMYFLSYFCILLLVVPVMRFIVFEVFDWSIFSHI